MKTNYSLTIGWLYPQLMSTYGDRGNILVLQKRAAWRGIKTEIVDVEEDTSAKEIAQVDLLFGGGAQDREQEIVMRDLMKKKAAIKELVEKNKPALFVCGAPQLMGNYYESGEGQRIEGLGIFDMYSKHLGPNQNRLIGNVVARISPNVLDRHSGEDLSSIGSHKDSIASLLNDSLVVGFENHGGRTYLGEKSKPFARVLKGFGNNSEDGTEGVVYKNAIGSYLHGPLLLKNPEIADWLIATALEVKYKKEIQLKPLDNMLEEKAKEAIMQKLKLQ